MGITFLKFVKASLYAVFFTSIFFLLFYFLNVSDNSHIEKRKSYADVKRKIYVRMLGSNTVSEHLDVIF